MLFPSYNSAVPEQKQKATIGLWKLLGKELDTLTPNEEDAVSRLAMLRRRLPVEGGRVNTKTEVGFSACATFLDAIAAAAAAMRLEKAPRAYRLAFTVNYRSLFPDEVRSYRVDVLEASADQYAVIWVNGDKFEFSTETMLRAQALQNSWLELGAVSERWSQSGEQPWWFARPTRGELRSALVQFDFAWAGFESKYISELISIEEKARSIILQAAEYERLLQLFEARYGEGKALLLRQDYREAHQRLAGLVSKINSVANHRRKGREDLNAEVLLSAQATLLQVSAAEPEGKMTEALQAARILALAVVDSFQNLRKYFQEVQNCMERVDPHLCNNIGLVDRLVLWEESWEVGARYVQNNRPLASVCDLAAEMRRAQTLFPKFATMCEERDVELFMILPRLFWLRFLDAPAQQSELLWRLLPHLLEATQDSPSHERQFRFGAELTAFIDRFDAVRVVLLEAINDMPAKVPQWSLVSSKVAETVDAKHMCGKQGASDILLLWTMATGCRDTADGILGGAVLPLNDPVRESIEDIMRELEKWSIQLQRHCPDDWNQCCAILLKCLPSDSKVQKKEGAAQFRV